MKKLLLTIYILTSLLLPFQQTQATTVNLIGFEAGDVTECQNTSGTQSINSSTFASGLYGYRSNPTGAANGYCQIGGYANTGAFNTNLNINTHYGRFKFRYATKPSSTYEYIYRILDSGGNSIAAVSINSSGNLGVYDDTDTVSATGSTALSANTWYTVDFYTTNSTTSSYTLKINGTNELTGTISSYDASPYAYVRLGKSNVNGNTVDFFYDDFAVNDTGFVDYTAKILIGVANGAGNYATLSGGTGTTYTEVDEVPTDSDTTYVASAAANEASTYAMQDSATAGVTGNISAIKAMIRVKNDAAGNSATIMKVRSASTDSDMASLIASGSYASRIKVMDTDPATSASWTTGGLDGLEVGAKNNADADDFRISNAYYFALFTPATSTPSTSTLPEIIFFDN